MFSEHIKDCVLKLRKIFCIRRNLVLESFPIIEIVKFTAKGTREISIKLFYNALEKNFTLQVPDQKHYSTISHFDYSRDERHWVRDKNLIIGLIKDLKKSGFWQLIKNKDLITVNQNNKKSDKEELQTLLDLIKKEPKQ